MGREPMVAKGAGLSIQNSYGHSRWGAWELLFLTWDRSTEALLSKPLQQIGTGAERTTPTCVDIG